MADVHCRADFIGSTPSSRHSGQGWECLKLTPSDRSLDCKFYLRSWSISYTVVAIEANSEGIKTVGRMVKSGI